MLCGKTSDVVLVEFYALECMGTAVWFPGDSPWRQPVTSLSSAAKRGIICRADGKRGVSGSIGSVSFHSTAFVSLL